MHISLNWVKDFVALPEINIHDIANDFTMKTAEVEGVEQSNAHLSKIFVAEIKSLRKHPEADKLNLVTVNYGKEEIEVVCGAPNVKEGLKVPYAPIGVTLPNGLKLEPKKIRGVLSSGMLCSEVELDLGEGASGLMELSSDADPGDTLLKYLDAQADTIIEVDNKSLTHRPDLWGVYGIAREFSAIYDNPLCEKFNKEWTQNLESHFNNQTSPIKPSVSMDSSCLAFWGLSVDSVKVKDSPKWMQERLKAVGLRPINNIVDISNYVMIELGMPLHIYDRESIKGDKVIISRCEKDTTFQTLDEIERKLVSTDTVIADSEKPLVLAGVMGGLNSGVTEKTSKVFIEVANWQAEEVRKTSTRLGLRTDSSTRYEKSLDSHLAYRTLLRTLELVLEENPNAKVIGKAEYDGRDLKETRALILDITLEKINNHLGTHLSSERVHKIFESLDFKTSLEANNSFKVIVPTYRATKDIQGPHDLIEEVGRIIGYDSIENLPPKLSVKPVGLSPYKKIERMVQDFFCLHASSLEVMSYPLVGEKILDKVSWPNKNLELKLLNAITNEADRMRPSLVPSFMEIISLNSKNFSDFSFYEWGRIYEADEKDFSKERNILGLCLFSKSKSKFIETLDVAEKFLNYLGLNFKVTPRSESKFASDLIPNSWVGVHPHECVDFNIRGKSLGVATSVHPLALRDFKVKGHASLFMVDLTMFTKSELKKVHKYEALAKFPSSIFDCSVVMKNTESASKLLEVQKKLKNKDLQSIKLIDTFKLNDDEKSVTLRFSFQRKEETLSSELIKEYEDKCVSELEKMGYPLKS